MLRKFARRVGIGLATAVVLVLVAVIGTARWGDRSLWPPARGTRTVEIFVVNHGYHAGIVIPKTELALHANARGSGVLSHVIRRFDAFNWLEIGWGDEGFYRNVPIAESLTVALAVRALFRPGNPSVLHVVGGMGDPRATFRTSGLVRVDLGDAGFVRLADKLDASFARDEEGPEVLGPGIYGPSLFFRANGAFHIFQVCNHWIANLLDAAGVPTAPVLATLPDGLLLDLKWRSGLGALPPLHAQ